jgi:L,D-transpeptidase ErfK/SrfK
MNRNFNSENIFNRLRLATVAFIFILTSHGCAVLYNIPAKSLPSSGVPDERIERNDFSLAKDADVIGPLIFMRLEKEDTLPDIARHFSLGINEISAANPGVDIWVPEAGERIMLPLSFILPDAPRKGIVINLAAMRLFQFKGDGKFLTVSTYPVGIGSEERPTPIGQMYVQRKTARPTWHVPASIAEDHRKKGDILPAKVPPGPDNPLGEYALYLSNPSYLTHGTNKTASIGLNATNGCIRLYPEHIKKLYENTPVNTRVSIVNQPYLVGRRNGVVYMEVHPSLENSAAAELDRIYAKLKTVERKSARKIDWKKVGEVLTEARGIPVPISGTPEENADGVLKTIEVAHPVKLYGRPEIPELKVDSWYVMAADQSDRTNAMRIAAIINHQGPQIPARILSKGKSYRVIAGPFNDVSDARDAVKRLKIDLDIKGILIEPAGK